MRNETRIGLGAAALLTCALGPGGGVAQPLSAIDWLSEPAAAEAQDRPNRPVTTTALPEPITVRPLNGPQPDTTGLFPAAEAGLPAELWGGSDTDDVAAAFGALPVDMLPALRRLAKDLLLAESDAPRDSDGSDFFLSRVDTLLRLGDANAAQQLLARVGSDEPGIFRRSFDTALLTGTESRACLRMRRRPALAPTYAARVFCLARGGDWRAAALTLETGEALGVIDGAKDALLARFLDAEIAGDLAALPPPRNPTPLVYVLLDAVGEPISTDRLPLAFAQFDMRAHSGWRQRVGAAERLAAAGAIPAERLIDIYAEREPPASGAVWDRVRAAQAVLQALDGRDAEALGAALPEAWSEMRSAGLAAPFAQAVAPRLARLPLSGQAAGIAFEMALLTDGYRQAAAQAEPEDERMRGLVALALGQPHDAEHEGALEAALHEGLTVAAPEPRFAASAQDGRTGEAILMAMQEIQRGAAGDLDELAPALAFLRAQGLTDTARRAALEILLGNAPA